MKRRKKVAFFSFLLSPRSFIACHFIILGTGWDVGRIFHFSRLSYTLNFSTSDLGADDHNAVFKIQNGYNKKKVFAMAIEILFDSCLINEGIHCDEVERSLIRDPNNSHVIIAKPAPVCYSLRSK